MQDRYTQCDVAFGAKLHTAWLPHEFARVGAVITIDGVGADGVVTATYSTVTRAEAVTRSVDWSRQRRASDA